jgi:hypothetical protein
MDHKMIMKRGVLLLTMDTLKLAEEEDLQVGGNGGAQTFNSSLMTCPYFRGPGS